MQQNNESQNAAVGVAVLGVFAIVAFALAFAVVVVLSLFVTGLAIRTFEHPIVVFGRTYTAEDGRAYLKRGVIGAIAAPVTVLFASVILGTRFNPGYFWMLPVGGYALGSLVVGYWIEQAKQQDAEAKAAVPMVQPPQLGSPVRTIPRPAVTPLPGAQSQQPEPFRFATWDDEEELRK